MWIYWILYLTNFIIKKLPISKQWKKSTSTLQVSLSYPCLQKLLFFKWISLFLEGETTPFESEIESHLNMYIIYYLLFWNSFYDVVQPFATLKSHPLYILCNQLLSLITFVIIIYYYVNNFLPILYLLFIMAHIFTYGF